jgi:hypothetical protein
MYVEMAADRRREGARRRQRWVRPVIVVAAAALGVLPAGAFAAVPAALPAGCSQTGAVVNCTYGSTGAEQTFTVPAGVGSVQVSAIGAAGAPSFGGASGGRGAQVTGTLAGLAAGETLYVEVGGTPTHTGACFLAGRCIGGFNGGGTSSYGGGGGGASDVRTVSSTQPNSLESRLLVAGGGGGGGERGVPPCDPNLEGAAGGDAGAAGTTNSCPGVGTSVGGGAGTQVGGGAGGAPSGQSGILGDGGDGGGDGGGAGGGGLFGGGGGGDRVLSVGALSTAAGGGGGGSSLVPAGATASLTTAAPTITLTYSAVTSSTTSVTSAPNPSVYGQSVVFTATVTGNNPTGTVAFTSGNTTLCGAAALSSSGVATCTTTTLPVGTDTVTATYSGDGNDAPSHGSTTQSVSTATTTLTAGPATASLIGNGVGGVKVTGLSAKLTSKTTGAPISGQTITFTGTAGNVPLCTAVTDASGTASCTATLNKGYAGNILAVDDLVIFGYTATYVATSGDTGSTASGAVSFGAA